MLIAIRDSNSPIPQNNATMVSGRPSDFSDAAVEARSDLAMRAALGM
jgi:hypothetical protein